MEPEKGLWKRKNIYQLTTKFGMCMLVFEGVSVINRIVPPKSAHVRWTEYEQLATEKGYTAHAFCLKLQESFMEKDPPQPLQIMWFNRRVITVYFSTMPQHFELSVRPLGHLPHPTNVQDTSPPCQKVKVTGLSHNTDFHFPHLDITFPSILHCVFWLAFQRGTLLRNQATVP